MEDHHIKIDMGFAGCCRFMLYASSDAYVGFTACICTAPPAAQGRLPAYINSCLSSPQMMKTG